VLLEAQHHLSLEEMRANPITAYGIQHVLQICLETLINMAHHIIAACNFATPKSHAESFEILAREGVITDEELLRNLKKMSRFRNLVVHRYWDVNDEIVYEILHKDLQDFKRFAEAVNTFLVNNPHI
jgi:uncharacterized protein YutE (UPF0331/DUF86 family)